MFTTIYARKKKGASTHETTIEHKRKYMREETAIQS